MQLNILIVGVLFPAIPLMMINFGNRYSLLAGLIRNLHDTVINEKISADDSGRFFAKLPAFFKDCGWSPSFKPAARLPLSLTFQRWFHFILASIVSVAGYFSYQSFWWLRRWFNSPSKSRLPIRPLMCICPIWRNIKNGRIIWHHQNRAVENPEKQRRRRRPILRPNLWHGFQSYLFSFLRCR